MSPRTSVLQNNQGNGPGKFGAVAWQEGSVTLSPCDRPPVKWSGGSTMAGHQGELVVLLLSTVGSDTLAGVLAWPSHGDPLPHEAPGLLAKSI